MLMTNYSQTDLATFKDKLTARIAELQDLEQAASSATDTVILDQSTIGRLSRMDAMQGQAMAQATALRRTQEIHELQQALSRIEQDCFGECSECLELINPRRIAHNPAVTLCLTCASAAETI